MSDPRGDASAPIFTVSRDGACDDAALLGRIGRGDEDAMASFYREHGRVGQPVTVTTTASTFVAISGPLLSDITDGASVMVRGHSSDGMLAAAIVTVGQPFSAVNPPGFVPVQGTVSDAGTAGFTLVTSGGTRVPVTTSSDTLVVVPHASLGQLQARASIFAVGHAGPDGTLSARGVAAITQPPSGPRLGVSVRDCSPSSIDEALGAISAAPVSAS